MATEIQTGVDQLPEDKSNLNDMISIKGKSSHPDPANQLGESYKDILTWPGEEAIDYPKGADPVEAVGDDRFQEFKGEQSLMNDYHIISIKGINGNNYPKFDQDQAGRPELYQELTASDLIANPIGANIFKPSDFLYASRYGKVPLNRLITLRRFAYPVPDDIFSKHQAEPDIARMCTFMDQDINPINEVVKFDWGLRWRELTAAAQTVSMNGTEDGTSMFMQKVMDYIDPKRGKEAMLGDNRLNFNPLYDNNKVYGPVDSIANTRIRDIGLDFNFEVNLTFDYTLRSINGVNAKTAMIDIVSNALATTMNNGKFWGGARHWVGRRPSQFLNSLKFMHARNFDEFLRGGMEEIRGLIGKFSGGKGPEEALKVLKQIAINALNINFGKIMDAIGRPSIPVFDSLLKNEPLGEWHLTVGNPRNPIITIGNLTIDRTSFEVEDFMLGNDDFPTKVRITVTLKPQMPRDKAGIESIFNAGKGRTYWKPKSVQTTTKRFNRATGSQGQDRLDFNRQLDDTFRFDTDAITRNFRGAYDFLKTGQRYEPIEQASTVKQKPASVGNTVKPANTARSNTGQPALDKDKSEKNPFTR